MNETAQTLLELLEEHKALGLAEQLDYGKFCLYSLITHSTAIEGSTVTEIENQLLFDEGITAKGRSMAEHFMNLDLKAAYERSLEFAKNCTPLSVVMLRELSALVMKNTGGKFSTLLGEFDSSKGDLRLVNVSSGAGGGSYMNFKKVPESLEKFCLDTNSRLAALPQNDVVGQYYASFDAHFGLVTIHPWVDGNGRMARLVMNQIQAGFGLLPSKVESEDKAAYIKALVDAREAGGPEPFREFMLAEHVKNLKKELETARKSL